MKLEIASVLIIIHNIIKLSSGKLKDDINLRYLLKVILISAARRLCFAPYAGPFAYLGNTLRITNSRN